MMPGAGPRRVIIDTDPGLDDAVAILYALAEPRLRVEAITTVAGNIGLETTTRNAGRLLAVMERNDIPYAAGASRPLEAEGRNEAAIHGEDGLGGVELPEPLAAPVLQPAVELLAARLLAAPEGQITLLALAPLTNLALLARDHPLAFARIGAIVAMGGTIHEPGNAGPHAEFNIAADPHAAAMVFAAADRAGVPFTLIPLDVTRRVRATPRDLGVLAAAPATSAQAAAALIAAYFAGSDRQSRPLHDPCVMLYALAPELFGTEALRLSVDCDEHPGRLVPPPGGARVDVALGIDAPGALSMLWQGLAGSARERT